MGTDRHDDDLRDNDEYIRDDDWRRGLGLFLERRVEWDNYCGYATIRSVS